MKHIISLGAGVQSSTMALMAAKGEIKPMPDCAIFADTGWEPPHVYKFLDWLEGQLPFPVHRASKNGNNLRDHIISSGTGTRYVGPPFFNVNSDGTNGMIKRQCTSEFKIEPLIQKTRELLGLKKRQRAKGKFDVIHWIGISTDEAVRMKPSRNEWIEHRWPLIEQNMNRNDCLKWMEKNGYPRPEKSSCIGCPYHDNATWRDMKLNRPDEWADAVEIDQTIKRGVKGYKEELFMHNSRVPLEDIDFRSLEDMGQINMFENECEGMCGV
jgi:hypothetical protein